MDANVLDPNEVAEKILIEWKKFKKDPFYLPINYIPYNYIETIIAHDIFWRSSPESNPSLSFFVRKILLEHISLVGELIQKSEMLQFLSTAASFGQSTIPKNIVTASMLSVCPQFFSDNDLREIIADTIRYNESCIQLAHDALVVREKEKEKKY